MLGIGQMCDGPTEKAKERTEVIGRQQGLQEAAQASRAAGTKGNTDVDWGV